MNVTVYSAEWCGPCRMLKSAFEKENIDYTTIDIEACATEAKAAGVRGVPTIVITKENKKEVRIVGFNPATLKRIKEVLDIG